MKILINGGLGFVGINLINHLFGSDMDDLVIVDALVEGNNFQEIKSSPKYFGLKLYGGERYLTKNAYLKIMMDEKPDCVVNLASLSHVDSSYDNPSLFYQYNIEYFNNLLQAISEYDKRIKLIHMSTDEVFGSIPEGMSITENGSISVEGIPLVIRKELLPSSPYSISKLTQEFIIKSMQDSGDLLNTILFRSTNLFGRYQDKSKLIPKVISNMKNGKDIPIYGDGKQKRTWLHVLECVGFIKHLINNDYKNGSVFHISDKQNEVTNNELVSMISRKIPRVSTYQYIKDRKNHDTRYSLDYKETSEITGFCPLLTLNSSLKGVIDFYE